MYSSKGSKAPKSMPSCGGCKFTYRNLMPVNPKQQQFQPTTSTPIRSRKQMGGVS